MWKSRFPLYNEDVPWLVWRSPYCRKLSLTFTDFISGIVTLLPTCANFIGIYSRYYLTLLNTIDLGRKKEGAECEKVALLYIMRSSLACLWEKSARRLKNVMVKKVGYIFPLVNDRTIGWFFYAPKCPSSCHRLSLLKPLRRSFFKAALITVFKGILQQKKFIFAHV